MRKNNLTHQTKYHFRKIFFLLILFSAFFLLTFSHSKAVGSLGAQYLGRVTDSSITVNTLISADVDAYISYGTISGNLDQQTAVQTYPSNSPIEVDIQGLTADTEYFYQIAYKEAGDPEFSFGPENSFRTQRAPGETFTFTIQSDSHLGNQFLGNAALYNQTLINQLTDNPDFMIDLGDTIEPGSTQESIEAAYLAQRQALSVLSGSTPIFFTIGNLENEEGWFRDGTANNQAVIGTNIRKEYFPNPIPNTFFSGDSDDWSSEGISGDGLRESYYSFEWGDALFVVLDPYWHTTTKPHSDTANSDPQLGSGDGWDWTLGDTQYFWLKQTLEQSTAKHKFVFSHHTTGGTPTITLPRGGKDAAPYYEWGGNNADGTYGFADHRPNWPMPIQDIFAQNGVDVFFHGHDHLFAYEEVNGVIYQEVPQAADGRYSLGFARKEDIYNDAIKVQNSGHLRVTVSPTNVQVDYVRSFLDGQTQGIYGNGDVSYSYTFGDNPTPTPTPTNTPTPTPVVSPTPTPTPIPTVTPTPTPTPVPGSSVHVADLDGSSLIENRAWNATVAVLAHDDQGQSVDNVLVTGVWENGLQGSCLTDATGRCSITQVGLSRWTFTQSFTVTNLSHPSFGYAPAENTDPDGDSDGTVITVNRPVL